MHMQVDKTRRHKGALDIDALPFACRDLAEGDVFRPDGCHAAFCKIKVTLYVKVLCGIHDAAVRNAKIHSVHRSFRSKCLLCEYFRRKLRRKYVVFVRLYNGLIPPSC